MKHLILAGLFPTFAFFGMCNALAQDGRGTSFRGLYINMTRADAMEFTEKEFKREVLKAEVRFVHPTEKNFLGHAKVCAIVSFDENNSAKQLDLRKCFFSADDLNDDQFAQAIVDNYGVQKFSCTTERNEIASNIARKPVFEKICQGPSKLGEWVVTNDTGVEISRRTQAQRPKFN